MSDSTAFVKGEHIAYDDLTEEDKKAALRKVLVSSFLGNFIEWFDYASYSYLATVLAYVFFPSEDHTVATIMTFGVFALSFLIRPLGSLFWGPYGDKHGRKNALAISILLMTGATGLIGLLPPYAMIGAAAPLLLLLLRCCQSFSAAGEYAGAATFIAEYSSKETRGFHASFVPASTAIGLLVGSLLATTMYNIWGADSSFMINWGWRFFFLLAIPLGWITHYIRTHVEDSPVYQVMEARIEEKQDSDLATHQAHPLRNLFMNHRKTAIIAFGSCILNAVGFYAVLTFMPTYLETTLGYDAAAASTITSITLVAYIIMVFISGKMSDKFGRKKMLLVAAASFVVLTVPMFMLMGTMQFWLILLAQLVMNFLLCINDGSLPSYMIETFPTEVRYTGYAFVFSLANGLFGGSTSYIALSLTKATGSPLAPAFYMVVIAAVALICIAISHENSDKDLNHI